MYEVIRNERGYPFEVLVSNVRSLVLRKGDIWSVTDKKYFSPEEIALEDALCLWWAGWESDDKRDKILGWCGGPAFINKIRACVLKYLSE